jgi:hypothetical protein
LQKSAVCCPINALRKILSILLLAIFGLTAVAPLVASATKSDAGLPACCRSNGRHHCIMNASERSSWMSRQSEVATPQEKCSYLPGILAVAYHPLLAIAAAASLFAILATRPNGIAHTESKWRIARDRSRQKRGPPVILSV